MYYKDLSIKVRIYILNYFGDSAYFATYIKHVVCAPFAHIRL